MKNMTNRESMYMPSVKDELMKLIQEQPDDSTNDEIVRELIFNVMLKKGLKGPDAGLTISN